MNLYLRLIWLLLRLPWLAKQVDPLAEARLTMRVMPNDLDLNFHVNNGRYLTMMDLGRIHLMSVNGLLKQMIKNRWAPMLGSAKIHFIRSLNLFEKFTMTSQVIYWDEKWIYLEQKIYKNETLCVVALLKALCTHKGKKISADMLIAQLPHPPVKPPLPHTLRFWIEAEKASKEGQTT